MRLFGPPNVEKMKLNGDVDGLIKALDYKNDSNTRGEAANALERLRDIRSVEPLIRTLSDVHPYPRICAIDALCAIGDIRATEPLTLMLKDDAYQIRKHAVHALCKIRDPRAIVPLIAALNDSNEDVRVSASKALKEIADIHAVEPLISSLNDSSAHVRANVAQALGKIGDSRAIKPLLVAIQDDNFNDISWYSPIIEESLNKLGWKPEKDELISLNSKPKQGIENITLLKAVEEADVVMDSFDRLVQRSDKQDEVINIEKIIPEKKVQCQCGACGQIFKELPIEEEDLGIIGTRRRFRCPYCHIEMNYYQK
jgi:hypothetical protein